MNVLTIYTSPTQKIEGGSLSKKILDEVLKLIGNCNNILHNLDNEEYFYNCLTSNNFLSFYDEKSDKLIDELKSADLIIICAPTINLTIPSLLKNYFDKIVQSKKSFKYTENGLVGLLNKETKLLVLNTQGSSKEIFAQTIEYITNQFKFLGINKIHTSIFSGTDINKTKEQDMKNIISRYQNEFELIKRFLDK